MPSIPLNAPEFPGDGYHTVAGDNFVVLEGRYDPDQYWFAFDGTILLFRHKEKETTPDIVHKPVPLGRIKRKLSPPNECQQPYIPIKGVEQYVLPVEKWQFPSANLSAKIRVAEYPCFERDEDDHVYVMRLASNPGLTQSIRSNEKVREWLAKNCTGRVLLDRVATFEKADDAIFAAVSGIFSKYEV